MADSHRAIEDCSAIFQVLGPFALAREDKTSFEEIFLNVWRTYTTGGDIRRNNFWPLKLGWNCYQCKHSSWNALLTLWKICYNFWTIRYKRETSSLWYGFSESAGFVNLARLFRNLEHSSSNCELLIYDVDMYDVDMYVHDKPEIKSVKVKKKLSCILISSSLR